MKCQNDAVYRFTWPGHDESFICEEHKRKLEGVAGAMGLYLQIIPLNDEQKAFGWKCNQITKDQRPS